MPSRPPRCKSRRTEHVLRALGATSLALGIVLAAATAHAQKFSARGLVTAAVGVNAVQADGSAPAGVALPGGAFFAVTPEVQLTYDRPRIEQTFDYAFTLNVQFNPDFSVSDGNATYANRAAYQAHIYATPTVDLLFGASVIEAPVNVVTTAVNPAQIDVAPAAAGYAYNLQGVLNEAVTKQFSENWSGTESGAFTFGVPVNVVPARQRVFAGTVGLAAARAWNVDTGTLTAASTFAHFTAGADFVGVATPAFDQSVNTLIASWRHEWSGSWSSQLDGGLLQAVTVQNDHSLFWQPTGAATIDFTRPSVAAELAYVHGALLNVYLAQLQLIDEVAARVSVPVGKSRDVTASATAAFERTRAIAADGSLIDPLNLWIADAGVAWAPHTAQNFTLGARLSLTKQDPAGPAVGGVVIPGFVRETALVTVTYGYPSAAIASPAYLSPIYRPAPVTHQDFQNVELRHPSPETPAEGDEQGAPNANGAAPAP